MPSWKANFIRGVIDSSEANNWDEAVKEWGLEAIFHTKDFERCLCEHDIKENCIMRNSKNGNRITVGNCCIKKFPMFSNGENERTLTFKALSSGRINASLIDMAHKFGYINKWEHGFMMNVWRKRKFSVRQLAVYERVKSQIFVRFDKERLNQ